MKLVLEMPLEFRLAICMFLGALAASLANFGIYRFAWNKRLVSPWSPAPKGAGPRTWADRIPILGWLFLRREVAFHGSGFWIRPMIIELIAAAGFAALYVWEVHDARLFMPAEFVPIVPPGRMLITVTPAITHGPLISHLILIVLMLIATFIDIDEKTIPDQVTITGTLVGLILAVLNPWSMLPGRTFSLPGPVPVIQSEFLHITSPLQWSATLNGGAANYWSLAVGLLCFWLWCFAILPRSWHGRYGLRRALRYFFARIFRDLYSWIVFVVWFIGSIGIGVVWWSGGFRWIALLTSLVGVAAGTSVIWALRLMGKRILQKEAMGFGDVTLMAMIGAFVGWQAGLIVFFLAPLAGLVVGLANFIVNRNNVIPYGPFLCLATMVTLIYWNAIWSYLQPAFSMGKLIPLMMVACLGLMGVLLLALQAVKWVIWRKAS